MGCLLELKNINIEYVNKKKKDSVYAVKNLWLELDYGDSLGIVGESGSGKSTLAMGILRLLPPNHSKINGEIIFNNQDILKMTEQEFNKMRWKDISVVFQKAMNSLSPVHRISTQIEDIYRVHEPEASSEEIKKRMMELFEMVNLRESIYHLYPHELSGGMLQRVSIAMSLLFHPQLLILDEATTALDVVTQGQILEEIVNMEEKLHMTRIMITHDISVVSSSCNKAGIMYAGELMEMGDTKEVMLHPLHPYTQALIDSFPTLYDEREEFHSIPGNMPDMTIRQEGCIFADRCKKCRPVCRKEKPKGKKYGSHVVYCHLVK